MGWSVLVITLFIETEHKSEFIHIDLWKTSLSNDIKYTSMSEVSLYRDG